jgi:hypothetical protein
VQHTTENFSNLEIGDPLYFDVTTGSGFFSTTPRGVVFILDITNVGTDSSTFTVSEFPNGDAINLPATLSGSFQIANQARTFAGNNVDLGTQTTVDIINDTPLTFDGANENGTSADLANYSGGLVEVNSATGLDDLDWYFGTMVFYTASDILAEDGVTVQEAGEPATGLSNNTTYFIDSFFPGGNTGQYYFTLRPLPSGEPITSISGGSGAQNFKQIGISTDKNIFHLKDNGFEQGDMLRYDFPDGGRFQVTDPTNDEVNFYFVDTVYDQHNFDVLSTVGEIIPRTVERTGTDAYFEIEPTPVNAVGLKEPLSFAVTTGTIPEGLSLNTSTGVISGTPTEVIEEPGREVIITCTDADGQTAIQIITFQFNQPPFLYPFNSTTFTTGGANGREGPTVDQARSGVGNPAWANSYLNMNSRGTQLWTVPEDGEYRFNVLGAEAGRGNGWGREGQGARMRGTFSLTQGDVIKIAVGQRGQNSYYNGGGGGGSFVATENNSPMIVAGGGGGGSGNYSYNDAYDYTYTNANYYGSGSSNGYGGSGNYRQGGGAGFYGQGYGYGGQAFVDGARGGSNNGTTGGFGGGGTGGYGTWGSGAGGGGGWAGGGGGRWSTNAAGGSSYPGGNSQSNSRNQGYSNGSIQVSKQ